MDWSWPKQNWPPRSPDLNPFDYHVCGYMKAMVCAHKLNMRELLQGILSAGRSINNAGVLRRVSSSLVRRFRKCTNVQADGGHFERLALVLYGESVTVNITIYFNKEVYLMIYFFGVETSVKMKSSEECFSDM